MMKKELKLDEKGLLPAVIQDINTGEVLMVGYMNPESLKLTLESGQAWFYSRSRRELWHKGTTSGNYINVKEVWIDCDNDTILVKGEPKGPVCHTGNQSCFFQRVTKEDI
jgi:phosphoribosyl-AMP cyclohydrolase